MSPSKLEKEPTDINLEQNQSSVILDQSREAQESSEKYGGLNVSSLLIVISGVVLVVTGVLIAVVVATRRRLQWELYDSKDTWNYYDDDSTWYMQMLKGSDSQSTGQCSSEYLNS